MSEDRFTSAHICCDMHKVFGDDHKRLLSMTDDEIDDYCRHAGIVWEKLKDDEIMIHGCGISCYCHGGHDNPNLRPRNEKTD